VPQILRMFAVAFAKTFSKIFGIATITFFGRISSRDDDKVAFVGLASLTWLVLIVAVFIPAVGELIVAGVLDDDTQIRFLSVASVILIPPLNGFIISRVHNQDGAWKGTLKHLLKGYGYTAVIGATIVGIVIVVPVVKLSHIVRRYDLKHLAVMIPDTAYEEVLDEMCSLLEEEGIECEVTKPNVALRKLFASLAWVEGRIFNRHNVAKEMMSVTGEVDGEDYEVILHATDTTIVGGKEQSSYIYAVLAEGLDHQELYFTWDDASQHIEDEIRAARRALREGEEVDEDTPQRLEDELRHACLSTEEWNAVRRMLYRLELELIATRAESGQPVEPAHAAAN
jgi:hypothetical protein